ncbi:hypothetical protein ACFSO0_14865 [Brevibacillus sp. GCM10020057]|uniref:hypothetical protein n=1 Tax=Brevibacillus sp. GCM10020057 TaxID=3317327 RepID=UPI00362665B1
MRKSKAARKKARLSAAKARRRTVSRAKGGTHTKAARSARAPLRVHVRAPKVHVTTPTPQVTVTSPAVQVEAPAVNVQAPEPIVIPAPIVQVEVEAEEGANEISMKGLRRELGKCMRENQTVELLLAAEGGGEGSRRFRTGSVVRVEEGIVELKGCPAQGQEAFRILIPLNQIVALIRSVQPAAKTALGDAQRQETISLHWGGEAEESDAKQLASG